MRYLLAVFAAVFTIIPTAHAQIGLDFLNLPPGAEIGDVLSRLYVFGVGLVAIVAMIMLVIGGVQYMVAGDKDPGPAKERIRNAIWGLILALCSYLILYTINPDLTKKVILTPIEINVVAPPKPFELKTLYCKLPNNACVAIKEGESCPSTAALCGETCQADASYPQCTKGQTAVSHEWITTQQCSEFQGKIVANNLCSGFQPSGMVCCEIPNP